MRTTRPGVFEIASGDVSATVLADEGGRVSRLSWRRNGKWEDILSPWAGGPGSKGGAFPLIPFSGRVRNAEMSFGERSWQLDVSPSCPPHALHGDASRRQWHARQEASDRLELELNYPSPAWPFHARVEMTLICLSGAFEVKQRVFNLGPAPMPFGLGWHPYFPMDFDTEIDFLPSEVRVFDREGFPQTPQSIGSITHLRLTEQQSTSEYKLTDPRVQIRWPQRKRVVTMDLHHSLTHLVVHADTRRGVFAAEPASHAVSTIAEEWVLPAHGSLLANAILQFSDDSNYNR